MSLVVSGRRRVRCPMWYLVSLRSSAPYMSRIVAHATGGRPMTVYSGSSPLEKKNDRFGANLLMSMPRHGNST